MSGFNLIIKKDNNKYSFLDLAGNVFASNLSEKKAASLKIELVKRGIKVN